MNALLHIANQIGEILKQKNYFLAIAESCTGGQIAQTVTSVPGSSNWFDRGFVAYSNEAKQQQLGVSPKTLEQHGAVSEQTVLAMAEGAIKNSQAQVSIAITGVAGPTGGTYERPVGMVWIAWGFKDKKPKATIYNFKGDRLSIRTQATYQALEVLLSLLKK